MNIDYSVKSTFSIQKNKSAPETIIVTPGLQNSYVNLDGTQRAQKSQSL